MAKLLFQMKNPKVVEPQLWGFMAARVPPKQIVHFVDPIVDQLVGVPWTRFRTRALNHRVAFVRMIRLVNARPFICLQRVHPERIQIDFATFFVFAQTLRESERENKFSKTNEHFHRSGVSRALTDNT